MRSFPAAFAALDRGRRRRRRLRRADRRREDHRAVRAGLGRWRCRRRRRRRRRRFGRDRRRGRPAVEIVDQARKHAVGIVIPPGRGRERHAVHRKSVVEAELGGVEVAVLDPGIDIGREGVTQPGNALERPRAVAGAGVVGPRPAGAAARITAEPAAEIAVEQGIGHQRLDADVIARRKVGRRCRDSGGGPDVGDQRRADAEALELRALVARLAFELEDPELVPEDRIDVVAVLEIGPVAVVVGRGVVEDHVEIGVAGKGHAAFDPDIRAVRSRQGRRRQSKRGGRCHQ